MRDVEVAHQNIEHEILRASRRHLRIEFDDDQPIDAELGEQPRLHPERRQAKRLGVGLKEFARIGFEHRHGERHALVTRDAARLGDQRAMSAMNAVEIAQRNDGALASAGRSR